MTRLSYAALRHGGPSKTLKSAWKRSVSLGLRCDLEQLPPCRQAKISVTMVPAEGASDSGLPAEAKSDRENREAAQRVEMCEHDVRQLYIARDAQGAATYAQWLITPEDHHLIEAHSPGLYPPLKPGQVLLEGAYTFADFRRLGVMADGMHQLLEIARESGAHEAFTYVASDYLPSIRGCANVGFELDHMRVSVRHLLSRKLSFESADDDARAAWEAATAPRPA